METMSADKRKKSINEKENEAKNEKSLVIEDASPGLPRKLNITPVPEFAEFEDN